MERKSRLEAIKATRNQEREIISKLKTTINKMAEVASLDEERINRRIAVALKSEYGRINGLINLIASIAKWPAEQGDGASVSANQALLESKLGLDLLLLEDISSYKGFHTFHTDELEVVEGVQPDYENYRDYCTIFLEESGFNRASAEIKPVNWSAIEKRAKVTVKRQIAELKQAVADHNALVA